MSEKSSFRSLLEMSDKIAREELGDYYVMGASRMRNMLDCLESGAKQLLGLTAENERLRKLAVEEELRLSEEIDELYKENVRLREALERIATQKTITGSSISDAIKALEEK